MYNILLRLLSFIFKLRLIIIIYSSKKGFRKCFFCFDFSFIPFFLFRFLEQSMIEQFYNEGSGSAQFQLKATCSAENAAYYQMLRFIQLPICYNCYMVNNNTLNSSHDLSCKPVITISRIRCQRSAPNVYSKLKYGSRLLGHTVLSD